MSGEHTNFALPNFDKVQMYQTEFIRLEKGIAPDVFDALPLDSVRGYQHRYSIPPVSDDPRIGFRPSKNLLLTEKDYAQVMFLLKNSATA